MRKWSFRISATRSLIGTPGWELKYGMGLVRGFRWGTMTARAAVEYHEASSSHFDGGEYAVEYLRRISPSWRVYAGLEGTQDEVSLIGEVQWFVTPHICVKINNGVGLTPKAADWAPEVGVVLLVRAESIDWPRGDAERPRPRPPRHLRR